MSIDIPVAGKEEKPLSEEIGEGSHDELEGGIGFRRFWKCNMG